LLEVGYIRRRRGVTGNPGIRGAEVGGKAGGKIVIQGHGVVVVIHINHPAGLQLAQIAQTGDLLRLDFRARQDRQQQCH